MTTTTSSSLTHGATRPRLTPATAALFIVGGIAFFAYGPLHPKGSDHGDKTEQLHSMLVDPTWYPAHAVGLLAFACIAAGIIRFGRRTALPASVARVATVTGVIAVVGTIGAVIHLFAGTQAAATEDGGTSFLVLLFTGVETVVNPVWGAAMAALAVAGGLTRTLGNRIVLALGVIGGLAFALVTATIAFTDLFDPLFPVASLIAIWCLVVGVIGLVRNT